MAEAPVVYDYTHRTPKTFSAFLVTDHGDYTATADELPDRALWSVHFIADDQLGDTRIAEDEAETLDEAIACCEASIRIHRITHG